MRIVVFARAATPALAGRFALARERGGPRQVVESSVIRIDRSTGSIGGLSYRAKKNNLHTVEE